MSRHAPMLLGAVGASARPALEKHPQLEQLLEQHLDAARTVWPELPLNASEFLAHAGRLLPEQDPRAALERLHAADLFLALQLTKGIPAALAAFDRRFLRTLPPSTLGGPDRREDVLQLLRERLLVSSGGPPPRIAQYSGRGPLAAWVRMVAARIAGELNSHGARTEYVGGADDLGELIAAGNPELELARKDARAALKAALEYALGVMSARERALLRMHHVHGLTLDKLAAMYGESRSGIGRQVTSARERFLKLTRHDLRTRFSSQASDVDSLLGLVQSRMDLSLRTLLR